jgi:hypothetical protein
MIPKRNYSHTTVETVVPFPPIPDPLMVRLQKDYPERSPTPADFSTEESKAEMLMQAGARRLVQRLALIAQKQAETVISPNP